jgi:hypothetical protein
MVATTTNPAINDEVRQQFENPDPPQIGKSATDPQAVLLSFLRVATLRSKLVAVDLDSISLALEEGLVSVEGAVAWLDDLGLFEIVVQRPGITQGGRQ